VLEDSFERLASVLFWIFQLAREFSGGLALKDHSHVRGREMPFGMSGWHAFAARGKAQESEILEILAAELRRSLAELPGVSEPIVNAFIMRRPAFAARPRVRRPARRAAAPNIRCGELQPWVIALIAFFTMLPDNASQRLR
jgi:hypothetical protein